MRLHRVRVEDFRGIGAQEIALRERGVTVIEAPNETGKTSMVEAVWILLEHRDRSKRQEIRALQPVGRDVGTVVEVELSCGRYHLTCLKQFNKRPRTQLEVHAPAHEQHTGDEAHDRLQEILAENLDRALLSALWFAQGDQLRRPGVGASPSLSRALDRAAGGGMEVDDDGLIEAARLESERYFTRTGKPKAELQAADDRVAEAEEALSRITDELEALQSDIERAAGIEARLAEIARRRAEREPVHSEYEEQLARVKALTDAAARHEAALERARADVARADERTAARARQAEIVADATRRLADCDEKLAEKRADAQRLSRHLAELIEARDAAHAAAEHARADAKLRARDAELLEDEARLRELSALREQVERADDEARQAEELLAACELTDDRLEAIEAAHEALRRAEAQLEAGAPRATVEALAACDVEIDGETASLAKAEHREVAIRRERELVVPGLARIRVAPGTSIDALDEAHRGARAELERACREAGVASREAALELDRRRRRAEELVRGRDARLRDLLGEIGRDGLADEIRRREHRAAGYRSGRSGDAPLPGELAEARELLAGAEGREQEALDAAARARAAHDEFAPAVRHAELELARLESSRAELGEQLEREQRALAEARDEQPDEAIERARHDAEAARRAAEEELAASRAELDALDPERVEILARNERSALEALEAERRELEIEQGKVGERLHLRGEEGLGERREERRGRLERARAERDRLRRRARAARLLYDVLVEERDRAREAYRAPLVRAVEELGRIVYGRDFAVQLDDELRVAARTLGGATLPWDQLSSGAQEQLALLVGLACARLVEDGEGAPLILDDGLGYTDPGRLGRMGAALSEAGRHGQIVVLTCFPDRYRSVGDAATVRLAPAAVGAGADAEGRTRRSALEPA